MDPFTKRLQHLRDDERGMYTVFVGLGLAAFLAATTLAIDVGMFMTARSQAQNSADAGALAGATALAFNDFNNRTPTGPAVLSAINAAQTNLIMAGWKPGSPGASGTPSVLPADVTFPNDPAGNPTRVQVVVQRSALRGNPLQTMMGGFLGIPTVNVGATATAEAAPANAETCVLPFTIPDRWIEKVDGKCIADGSWTPNSEFNMSKSQGQQQNVGAACGNPDVYNPPGSANPTGYSYKNDIGLQLTLKTNVSNTVAPSMYNPWDLPGSVGGNDYRNNIASCNTNIIAMGDNMTPENGNMVGPTKDGTTALINKDSGAYWDTGCNCVKSSDPKYHGMSPRIAIIPLYDPEVYAKGQQSGKSGPTLQAVNFLGFFIESVDGSSTVKGRITPIGGLITGNGGPTPNGAFPIAIRLVQ